jgi:hypothetical protein
VIAEQTEQKAGGVPQAALAAYTKNRRRRGNQQSEGDRNADPGKAASSLRVDGLER